MLKILSAAQIREADAFTVKNEPVASIDLMERAAVAFVDCFVKNYKVNHRVVIVCGTGNNGGDGLAISRLLLKKNYKVTVYVIAPSDNASIDFDLNYKRLLTLTDIVKIKKTITSLF